MTAALGDAVKEVRASTRLAGSPSVIVSDEDEPSARLRHMMQAMGQNMPEQKPILEINPDHEIIKKLLADPVGDKVQDAAWLLFEQALLLEGVPLGDPVVFVQRLNRVLNQSI
jgi:molecular chaperone HtpG